MIREYEKNHCWQYEIRQRNSEDDIRMSFGLFPEPTENLKPSDFEMSVVDKESKYEFNEISEFIKRHEWLGKMSLYPTHVFAARLKSTQTLGGVIVMDMPSAFSKLLGEDTKKIERLISRGACISWSPKGLASKLLMWAIRWMVKNTQYRLFTAYSDPEARELGTIYQACNFHYLGQRSGTDKQYHYNGSWRSDRYFRARSMYKRLATNHGIDWVDAWQDGDSIVWGSMPDEIEALLRTESKKLQQSCESRKVMPKHKYCYILGSTKKETKELKRIFREQKPNLQNLEYPKQRGK